MPTCPNCESKQKAKDIDYLGDQKYQCPNCKPNHDHTCEECGKPATHNIIHAEVVYNVLPDGDFNDEAVIRYLDDTSHFFCDDHYSR